MLRMLLVLGLLLSVLPLAGQEVEDLGLSLEQLEDRLLYLVNQERSGRGLVELQFDPRLRDMARAHSLKMIQEKRLAHDFPGYEKLAGRAFNAGLYFSELGENVASGDTFVMRIYHEQLMSSPGHRENLLNDRFRQLGIGILSSGNQYYVTQEFASLFAPVPAAEMEREMENDLKARLGRQMLPPQAAAALKENCRRLASLFLKDKSPPKIADAMGVAAVYNFSFVDKEDGFDRMLAAIKGSRPLYWALGVMFDRPDASPGGIYALTLIVFPDLRDELKIYGGLEAVILEAMPKMRGRERDPKLDAAATELSLRFYRSPASPDSIQIKDCCKLILAYLTLSLAEIPEEIAQQIAGTPRSGSSGIHYFFRKNTAAPKKGSLGIHVFYPLLEGLLGNYFIVAIITN
jgi:hypothetical protein